MLHFEEERPGRTEPAFALSWLHAGLMVGIGLVGAACVGAGASVAWRVARQIVS